MAGTLAVECRNMGRETMKDLKMEKNTDETQLIMEMEEMYGPTIASLERKCPKEKTEKETDTKKEKPADILYKADVTLTQKHVGTATMNVRLTKKPKELGHN
jgi:phage FluMu protein Com